MTFAKNYLTRKHHVDETSKYLQRNLNILLLLYISDAVQKKDNSNSLIQYPSVAKVQNEENSVRLNFNNSICR